MQIVKVVPSLVIDKNRTRRICSHGKRHATDPTNCHCIISYCKSGYLACTFNTYPEDFIKYIPLTGKKL